MNKVLWLTGLSGSGKTTIAEALKARLTEDNVVSYVLDGDVMRKTISSDLGFIYRERMANIHRAAHVAKMLADCGVLVICCFISPSQAMRSTALEIIGDDRFYVVHIATTLSECERRDPKGMYKKAREGKIRDFTGVDSPYEPPKSPFLTLDTEELSVDECVDLIIKKIRL